MRRKWRHGANLGLQKNEKRCILNKERPLVYGLSPLFSKSSIDSAIAPLTNTLTPLQRDKTVLVRAGGHDVPAFDAAK